MAAHPPSSFAEQYNNPDISSAYLRIFKFLTIFSFMGFAFYAFFYWQIQTWQFLIAAVFLLISLIISVAGFHQVKRGHSSVANVLVFLGLIFTYSAPLLLWSHAEGYLIIAGLFVSIPVSMVLYTRWKQRIAAIGIFLLISILLSQVPVFTRYDIHSLPALNIFLFASAVFIILQSTWLLIRKIDIRTIKARLLISFIIIAVVPMVIVAGVATTSVIRGTENNAIDLLTVVLNLKVTAIHTWIDNLQQIMRQDFDVAADNDSLLGLLESEPGSTRFNEYGNDIQKRLEISLKTTPDFVDYLILDRNGLIRISTDPSYAGVNISQESYIRDALSIHSYNRIIDIPDLGGKVLLITEPILNQMNTPAGLKVGIANLDKLTQIMGEGDVMGETGEAYLVASDLTLLTESRFPGYPTGETKILTRGGLDAILGKQDGTGTYDNYTGTEILAAYHWLGDLDVAIFAEQSRSELFSPVLGTTLIIMLVSIFLIAGAVIFGLSISNSIGKPLAELTSVSQRIATGELDLVATVEKRQDEISDLADAFNKMTQQLRIFINDLERQVQSRTTEYETRNAQLLAASQLGNAITSFLDTDELVQQSVNLIQEKFSMYYVGLFLLDETHTLATLKRGQGILVGRWLNRVTGSEWVKG